MRKSAFLCRIYHCFSTNSQQIYSLLVQPNGHDHGPEAVAEHMLAESQDHIQVSHLGAFSYFQRFLFDQTLDSIIFLVHCTNPSRKSVRWKQCCIVGICCISRLELIGFFHWGIRTFSQKRSSLRMGTLKFLFHVISHLFEVFFLTTFM